MKMRAWHWNRYGGKSGNAGVALYAMRPGAIALRFKDDQSRIYVYDHTKPGATHVTQMQHLAPTGRGLTSYVNRHVRGNYSATYVIANKKPGSRRAS